MRVRTKNVFCEFVFQNANEKNIVIHWISLLTMKVSPLSPLASATEQDVLHHDNIEANSNNCSKRRKLHLQTNIIINSHYRHHRKHLCPRNENKSSPMDCFDTIRSSVNGINSNSCNSSNVSGEDTSDYNDLSMTPSGYPDQQQPEGETSPSHNKKVRTFSLANKNSRKLTLVVCIPYIYV